ncbi:GTP-binding protein TypA [Fusobacterium necrophorum subsp. funduliforme]|uniref:Large ribosomal subunit assembly factor BipA n=3 Tax=Fusobacterium necrophorum TaxID=859 RepID=A0A161QWZ8_9FUSO|nr:translational GTPase TypA [Fusobacterium necrophorum]EHO19457.1 GTP-binding protein TypA/BipA [Fusobacterium necrophorum subsp. funduliforme 1_1_36S]AVQ21568.1 translational GTPase TypA [Fusobacterium necrophorum subsp. funduliforme]AYV93057.1 translational GTPase TypA [Fusobacterium necrophorum subsp. funduliforme]AYZ74582.1 translational GTPase TypA [Fusobacterium necrophorum]AZW09534.1 translational GTPase TypA [Fusobacterium necrophorum subsp. necrophorum]
MKIKNIAIIAHVDHGKTTLVDCLLRQGGAFGSHELEKVEERIMDSDDIERERGITIFSKNASVRYKDYKINIVDTPGHADFGGEVQRIMKMVDSVLLLVDAFEGPMPQTKYVLKKALEQGHRPIVVVNKIDKPNSRPEEVLYMIYDLFIELNANDYQLEFPVIYASSKAGFAKKELTDEEKDMQALFDTILEFVEDPDGDKNRPTQFLITNTEYDNYVGKLAVGRIHNGTLKRNQEVMIMKRDGSQIKGKISVLYGYEGLRRVELQEAEAGDIVCIAGMENIEIGETLADVNDPVALPVIDIDEPTLAMTFMVNDSPFVGKDGKYVTSRHIWERLQKEVQNNVSMRVEATDTPDAFIVKGRGELQLSILLENMRREGFEVQVSKPRVLMKEIDGVKMEPMEMALIDVDDSYTGVVIEKMGVRKAEMIAMTPGQDGYTRLEFKVPARGLIGFRNEFLTVTKGTGILNHSFFEFEAFKGEIPTRNKGVLIATEAGVTVPYALNNLQDRGTLFLDPGVPVYEGMIVGEHNRENDLVVNVCKTKKLTNMRAAGSDDAVQLATPRRFSLEQALDYIAEDELVEVTPLNIRLRKKILKEGERRRNRSDA